MDDLLYMCQFPLRGRFLSNLWKNLVQPFLTTVPTKGLSFFLGEEDVYYEDEC